MTDSSTVRQRLDATGTDLAGAWAVVRRVAFGDRLGVVVFLAGLAFALATWRVGFLITDNWTLANALVNLADGQFAVTKVVYGPAHGGTPGMVVHDHRLYGRNYGSLFLALPVLWTIEAVTAVAPFTVAAGAVWSLLVLLLVYNAGVLAGRERLGGYAGAAVAVVAFTANAAVATPFEPSWYAFVALQVTTAIAAAFVGVLCYRIGTHVASRRVGAFVGVAAVLATPIGFWASSPKRHVFTALFVLATLYCLYRSRDATDDATALRFRALAYLPVGMTAWVHALEGLVLLGALVVADLLTARRNDARSLAVVAGAFALSLVPFFLTNLAITGSPIRTPRMLTPYNGEPLVAPTADAGEPTTGGRIASAAEVNRDAEHARSLLDRFVNRGVAALFAGPERLVQTFVRGGYIDRVAARDGAEAINLTVLESAPMLGALVAIPVLWTRTVLRRWRQVGPPRSLPTSLRTPLPAGLRRELEGLLAARHSPWVAADGFVVLYAAGLTLVNLPRLPLHAQATVRYLLPLFPLGLYALARLPAVRRAVDEQPGLLALSATATVFGLVPLVSAWVAVADLAMGEAFQLHALLGLAVATPLAAWGVATALGSDVRLGKTRRVDSARVGAVALGVATGVGSTFLLVTAFSYFAPVGPFPVPVADWLAGILGTVAG